MCVSLQRSLKHAVDVVLAHDEQLFAVNFYGVSCVLAKDNGVTHLDRQSTGFYPAARCHPQFSLLLLYGARQLDRVADEFSLLGFSISQIKVAMTLGLELPVGKPRR